MRISRNHQVRKFQTEEMAHCISWSSCI